MTDESNELMKEVKIKADPEAFAESTAGNDNEDDGAVNPDQVSML